MSQVGQIHTGVPPAPPKKLQSNGTLHADKTYIIRNDQGNLVAAGDTPEECYRQAFMFDTDDGSVEIAEYRLVAIRKCKIGVIDAEEIDCGQTQV